MRVGDGVGAAAGVDFRIQIHQVPLQRGHRYAERAGDLLIRRSVRHQPQHLQLASGQTVRGRGECGGPVRRLRACRGRALESVNGGDVRIVHTPGNGILRDDDKSCARDSRRHFPAQLVRSEREWCLVDHQRGDLHKRE